MSNFEFSVIADYITESGHYDASQVVEAADGIEAAILFLQNVRGRIESRETVSDITVRITIQPPESPPDSRRDPDAGERTRPGRIV